MKSLLTSLVTIFCAGAFIGAQTGCNSTGSTSFLTSLQTTASKVKAWNASPQGTLVLNTVGLAASAFEPQFAGVIGVGINSLETPNSPTSIPSLAATVTQLASVTGSSKSNQKVLSLATAVITAATSAPTAAAGLQAAANTVAPPAGTPAQVNVGLHLHETLLFVRAEDELV